MSPRGKMAPQAKVSYSSFLLSGLLPPALLLVNQMTLMSPQVQNTGIATCSEFWFYSSCVKLRGLWKALVKPKGELLACFRYLCVWVHLHLVIYPSDTLLSSAACGPWWQLPGFGQWLKEDRKGLAWAWQQLLGSFQVTCYISISVSNAAIVMTIESEMQKVSHMPRINRRMGGRQLTFSCWITQNYLKVPPPMENEDHVLCLSSSHFACGLKRPSHLCLSLSCTIELSCRDGHPPLAFLEPGRL